MNRILRAFVLTVFALLANSAPVRAGRFTFELPCDTLSVRPLRILLRFGIYSGGFSYGPLCRVLLEADTSQGVAAVPILGCAAPSWMTCATDSLARTADFVPDSCVDDYWQSDSLGIVVAAPRADYVAKLVTIGESVRKIDMLHFSCAAGTVDVSDRSAPAPLLLAPPSPNPSGGGAWVHFGLERPMHVSLGIFDSQGRRVRDLIDATLPAGEHSIHWDGRNASGHSAPSAVYFCRLAGESYVLERRLIKAR